MPLKLFLPFRYFISICFLLTVARGVPVLAADHPETSERKLLYVAAPGIRNYLEYGGHGILVYDINDHHKFLKRFASAGVDEKGQPLNIKGIAACAKTQRLYATTTRTLM
jgi:hypothetical protein